LQPLGNAALNAVLEKGANGNDFAALLQAKRLDFTVFGNDLTDLPAFSATIVAPKKNARHAQHPGAV
jgi:hypothetical protein